MGFAFPLQRTELRVGCPVKEQEGRSSTATPEKLRASKPRGIRNKAFVRCGVGRPKNLAADLAERADKKTFAVESHSSVDGVYERANRLERDANLIAVSEGEAVRRHDAHAGHEVAAMRKAVFSKQPVGK